MWVASLLCLATTASTLLAAEPITFGQTIEGRITTDRPAVYRFTTETTGALAVVLRADDGIDASIEVTDPTGQVVLFGRFNGDWYMNAGAEQGVITLDTPGDYHVFVEASNGEGAFRLMTALLPLPGVARPEDPLGSPATAAAIAPGVWAGESIRPARDDWRDWYRLNPTRSGVVTALLRGDGETDFLLAAYESPELRKTLMWADNDDQGRLGWETLTFEVTRGVPVYLRVTTRDEAAGDYRLMVGYVGGAEAAEPEANAQGREADADADTETH